MPKQHKIKRSPSAMGTYKARPHPIFVIFMIAIVGGLVYLGMIIYPPIHDAIMNWRTYSATVDPTPPIIVLDPTNGEEPDETPEPEPPPRPAEYLRAIYAPPELVSDPSAFDAFLDTLPGADLNAVMIDIKNAQGQVLHTSQVPNAVAWDAVVPGAIDLAELNQRLADRNLALIVRMSAFGDETAAIGNANYAVRANSADGPRWLDWNNRRWLNPHSEGARQYLTDLALEAVELGAVMVVLDELRFPPNSETIAVFPGADGLTRAQRLRQFADELTATLSEHEARLAIYMPSVALASPPNTTLFGGPAADILSEHTMLGALPYQFPAWFASEDLALPNPLEDLDYTIERIIAHAREQTDSQLIVLLQGGSLPEGAQYTDEQIMAQIDTLTRLGVREFVLFSPEVWQYQLG